MVLLGARQTGKTTLVRELVRAIAGASYATLDDAATRDLAIGDPEGFVAAVAAGGGLVAVDEVQRAPELILATTSSSKPRRVESPGWK